MKTKIWGLVFAAVVLSTMAGCVGTARASFTLNKTIQLDERPLEGLQIGWKWEWSR